MKFTALLLALGLLTGCNAETIAQAAQDRRKSLVADAKSEMAFFKEQETGLCFAFTWGGHGNGGPAMASVPCNKVENSSRFIR